MQRIYALLIDTFDGIVMLSVKKQMLFLVALNAGLFSLLWMMIVNPQQQLYLSYKKQQQILIHQMKVKKVISPVKNKLKHIGEALFCDETVMTKREVGTIKTDNEIGHYYETDKNCLLKIKNKL